MKYNKRPTTSDKKHCTNHPQEALAFPTTVVEYGEKEYCGKYTRIRRDIVVVRVMRAESSTCHHEKGMKPRKGTAKAAIFWRATAL